SGRHHVVLDKRFSHGEALRLKKRVCHHSANEKLIDLSSYQRFNNRNFVRDLYPTKYGHEWPLGIIESLAEKGQFLFHQQARDLCIDVMRDTFGRSVRAMCRSKCVI